jgi:hypothetical protein
MALMVMAFLAAFGKPQFTPFARFAQPAPPAIWSFDTEQGVDRLRHVEAVDHQHVFGILALAAMKVTPHSEASVKVSD